MIILFERQSTIFSMNPSYIELLDHCLHKYSIYFNSYTNINYYKVTLLTVLIIKRFPFDQNYIVQICALYRSPFASN